MFHPADDKGQEPLHSILVSPLVVIVVTSEVYSEDKDQLKHLLTVIGLITSNVIESNYDKQLLGETSLTRSLEAFRLLSVRE